MHFCLVTDDHCLPFPTKRGTAINTWSIMQALLRARHDVTVVVVSNKKEAEFADLKAEGVNLRTLPYGDIRPYEFNPRLYPDLLKPRMQTFYPWADLGPAMQVLLDDIAPDAVLAYQLFNLSATHGVSYPRMAIVIDLDHMVGHYRWFEYSWRTPARFYSALIRRLTHARQPRFMRELLKDCASVVDFAAHHAQWLKEHGTPHSIYIPPPTRDPFEAPHVAPRTRTLGAPAKILLPGHLGGIATIAGIRLLLDHVLPRLEQRLPPSSFEVHVVGDHSRHPWLAEALRARPCVRLRGYVEDINAEFLSADVLLVPTPIHLGTRTRVIEGFAYGCCIVSHEANALGIPQLVDGKNGLLARDGQGLADAVIRAINDTPLRQRLQTAARGTFDEYFSLDQAGRLLIAELERIAGEGRAHTHR